MNDPVDNLAVAVVLVAIVLAAGFSTVVHTLLHLKGTIRMGLAELAAAAQGVVDQAATMVIEIGVVGNSVTAEISRVEKAITVAKANGVDPALLDPITAQLTTAKQNLADAQAALSSSQAALDTEQAPPAPAPTPAPDPSPAPTA